MHHTAHPSEWQKESAPWHPCESCWRCHRCRSRLPSQERADLIEDAATTAVKRSAQNSWRAATGLPAAALWKKWRVRKIDCTQFAAGKVANTKCPVSAIEGRLHGLIIADFPNDDDIRILPHASPQCRSIGVSICPNLALFDDTAYTCTYSTRLSPA